MEKEQGGRVDLNMKKEKRIPLFISHISYFIFSILFFSSFAQTPDGRIVVQAIIVGEDTMPVITLPYFDVVAPMNLEAFKNMQRYNKLRFNVRKVYPYARLAAAKLNEINANVGNMKTEKEKRKYIKAEEKKLKDQFEAEIKDLTITQGRILIKLIDRETSATAYALVKELRGTLQAFLWQGIARLFGENLKEQYDSAGEDQAIEQIIRELQAEQVK